MIIPTKPSDLERFCFHFARDLPPFSDQGVQIRVDEKENGRLCIALECGETTTAADLRKAVPLAMKWRVRLNEFQGRIGIEHNELLLKIQEYRESGKSFVEIAELLNCKIGERLREYSELADGDKNAFIGRHLLFSVREALAELNAGQEDLRKGRGRNGKVDEEASGRWIDHVIADALQRISRDENPFDCPGFPLSGSKVIYTYGQWRERSARKKA